MNKDNLQKELLKKVKPGIKPSDLKKQKQQEKINKSLSPISINEDEGYWSGEEEKIVKTSTPISQPLPDQKIKTLQTEISSLKRQLQTYKDFKVDDLKTIKELQTKNKSLNKTIEELKSKQENKENVKEPVNKSFFCDGCQLTKQGNFVKKKVDSPFELRLHGKTCYLCSSCSPYYKELNDSNFDKDNNPYKLY